MKVYLCSSRCTHKESKLKHHFTDCFSSYYFFVRPWYVGDQFTFTCFFNFLILLCKTLCLCSPKKQIAQPRGDIAFRQSCNFGFNVKRYINVQSVSTRKRRHTCKQLTCTWKFSFPSPTTIPCVWFGLSELLLFLWIFWKLFLRMCVRVHAQFCVHGKTTRREKIHTSPSNWCIIEKNIFNTFFETWF